MRHNVINLDECKSTETYWITMYRNSNNKNGSYTIHLTLRTLELNTYQKNQKFIGKEV